MVLTGSLTCQEGDTVVNRQDLSSRTFSITAGTEMRLPWRGWRTEGTKRRRIHRTALPKMPHRSKATCDLEILRKD